MAVNRATLLGHTGADPKVHVFDTGDKVVQISLATTVPEFTTKDGHKVPERTEWHNVVLYRGLADIAEKYVHKGDKLYIEGEIRYRSYDDEQKNKRYITEIYANKMELLTPKPKGAPAPPPPSGGQQPTNTQQGANTTPQGGVPQDDDLPF